MNECKSLL